MGAIGLVAALSIINPIVKDEFKDKEKIAVSVVSCNKLKETQVASGQTVVATTETITSYASGSVISIEEQNATKEKVNKTIATPKPTVRPNPRKEIVKLAKKYKGKITYLWGGKPTDADISGKQEPEKLDCSGFIQFVYSRYSKKRISTLGSTIAIAGLPKIKKDKLKPGDIGLRNGTGSLYFDADGKSYYEPDFAEKANEKKEKLYDKKIKDTKEKKSSIKKKINDKKTYIAECKSKKELLQEKSETTDAVENIEETEIGDEESEELIAEKEKQKKEAEKNAAAIIEYEQNIEKCKEDIDALSKKIKKYDKKLKKLKKQRKKYTKDIEESIDHVGIYCGKNKKGKDVWCHCASSKGGVVYEVTDIFTHYYSTSDCL